MAGFGRAGRGGRLKPGSPKAGLRACGRAHPLQKQLGYCTIPQGHWDLQEHLLRLQKPLATLSCPNSSAVQIPGELPGGSALGQGVQRPSFPLGVLPTTLGYGKEFTAINPNHLHAYAVGKGARLLVKSNFSCSCLLELIKLLLGDGARSLSFQEPDVGSMKT